MPANVDRDSCIRSKRKLTDSSDIIIDVNKDLLYDHADEGSDHQWLLGAGDEFLHAAADCGRRDRARVKLRVAVTSAFAGLPAPALAPATVDRASAADAGRARDRAGICFELRVIFDGWTAALGRW